MLEKLNKWEHVFKCKSQVYLQQVPPFLGVQSFRGFLGDPVEDKQLSVTKMYEFQ